MFRPLAIHDDARDANVDNSGRAGPHVVKDLVRNGLRRRLALDRDYGFVLAVLEEFLEMADDLSIRPMGDEHTPVPLKVA